MPAESNDSNCDNLLAVDELGSALRLHLSLRDEPSAGVSAPPTKPETNKPNKKSPPGGPKKQAPPPSASAAPAPPSETYDRWTLKDASAIDYGYLGATQGKGIANKQGDNDSYYITTAINYTNGPAHMGHAYEAVTSDVVARYHRLESPTTSVYFLTGTDEHGQKIANTAADQGQTPMDICDLYSTGFKVLNQRLLISNDDYVRTTQARHKRTAQELWTKCSQAGDIYLDTYEGWYNVKEETFVTDSDAKLWDYKDPTTGQPLKKVHEESYFFKMSKYQQRLVQHIQENPSFIQPDMHRNLILQRLQSDELRDLSISRTTFAWGIAVPKGFSEQHVMYVWVDALSNYLTGVNALGVNQDDSIAGLEKFWPANTHIIGKDILWFHTVIWPTLLMSANIALPKTVYAHGFVNDKEGKKMSKSLGNVTDPHDMLDTFDVDTFRWYLCKEAPYGGELSFSQDSMLDMHNADLCDNIGNCVNRATSLCGRFCNGTIPDVPPPERPPIDFAALAQEYQTKMKAYELQGGCQVAARGFSQINTWLQEEAPWAKKGDDHAEFRQGIVRGALEAVYALSHFLLPFMPVSGRKIFTKLGTEPVTLQELLANGNNNHELRNLKVGTVVETKGSVLYDKLLNEEEKKAAAAKKKDDYAESKRKKEQAKATNKAQSAAGAADPNQSDFTKLDIRVGKIIKVWNHPEADKLYCEQIDLGEESGPREIASGLREHYTLEGMQGQHVLVVCNLKPQKMLGFMSNGMVLAAKSSDGSKVELMAPPEGSSIGERVFIKGLTGEPIPASQASRKKVFQTVSADLKTDESCVATWKGQAIETKAGPCKAPSLAGAAIS